MRFTYKCCHVSFRDILHVSCVTSLACPTLAPHQIHNLIPNYCNLCDFLSCASSGTYSNYNRDVAALCHKSCSRSTCLDLLLCNSFLFCLCCFTLKGSFYAKIKKYTFFFLPVAWLCWCELQSFDIGCRDVFSRI